MGRVDEIKKDTYMDTNGTGFDPLDIPLNCLGDGGVDMAQVESPAHYKHGEFEVIDEMLIQFGFTATINFCQLNAWKYRARAPYKGKTAEDMAKADQYMKMAWDLQRLRHSNAVDDKCHLYRYPSGKRGRK